MIDAGFGNIPDIKIGPQGTIHVRGEDQVIRRRGKRVYKTYRNIISAAAAFICDGSSEVYKFLEEFL